MEMYDKNGDLQAQHAFGRKYTYMDHMQGSHVWTIFMDHIYDS